MFGLRRALCSRLQRNFQNHRVRASIFRNLGSATAPPRLFSCITLSGHFYRPHVPFVFNIFAAASNATALYMWRSNVLRLRKCSSAGGLRHGVARRLYSSEKSLPITDEEFHDALGSVLAERRAREGSNLTGAGVNKVPIGMWSAVIHSKELSLTIRLRPCYKRWCGFYGACISLCPSSRREQLLAERPWLRG